MPCKEAMRKSFLGACIMLQHASLYWAQLNRLLQYSVCRSWYVITISEPESSLKSGAYNQALCRPADEAKADDEHSSCRDRMTAIH